MDVLTLIYNTLLIAVTFSLCIATYHLVTGIKTKVYTNAKKSILVYLALNGIRLLMEHFVMK